MERTPQLVARDLFQSFQMGARRIEVLRGISMEIARNEAAAFVAHPPLESDLRRAIEFIRDHWQRRYGLVQVG